MKTYNKMIPKTKKKKKQKIEKKQLSRKTFKRKGENRIANKTQSNIRTEDGKQMIRELKKDCDKFYVKAETGLIEQQSH